MVWYEGSTLADRRFLLADERGSVIAGADSAGATLFKNVYDEYGKPGQNNQGRFQYTGQMWLAEAGLYHYKARIYDPGLGRFLQTDPIGYAAGLNLYAYVGGDPVNNTDPSGEIALAIAGCAVGAGINAAIQLAENDLQFQRLNGREIGLACATGLFTGLGGSFAKAALFGVVKFAGRYLSLSRTERVIYGALSYANFNISIALIAASGGDSIDIVVEIISAVTPEGVADLAEAFARALYEGLFRTPPRASRLNNNKPATTVSIVDVTPKGFTVRIPRGGRGGRTGGGGNGSELGDNVNFQGGGASRITRTNVEIEDAD